MAMKACRECGVLHAKHTYNGQCGACGFSDEDAPGNEKWCKKEQV